MLKVISPFFSIFCICLLTFKLTLQWNTPSITFYEEGLGAAMMSEWVGMRLEEEGIENLKRFSIQ